MKLKKIIAGKKITEVISVSADTPLKDVAKVLCKHKIGAVMVAEKNTQPPRYLGILSERDMLRQACEDKFFDSKAGDIMTKEMVVATVNDDVEYVMQIMHQKHIRHLPVLEDKTVVAVLSIRDIVQSMLTEKDIVIHLMSDLIGTYGNEVY